MPGVLHMVQAGHKSHQRQGQSARLGTAEHGTVQKLIHTLVSSIITRRPLVLWRAVSVLTGARI